MNSSPPTNKPRRVAVVGGGISGLAAAHRFWELDPTLDLHLYEAGERLGGVLQTVRRNGFLIERSSDGFITNIPWGTGLCRRIGMADELLQTNQQLRKVFVVHRGRLREIPQGFLLMAPTHIIPVLISPLISWPGKIRMGLEYFLPPKRDAGETDESMASFVRRRLGREAYDRIVQPLIGGIYTADPEKLSLKATMPHFLTMEQKDGGLIRGGRKRMLSARKGGGDNQSSGARFSMFVTPRDGMASIVQRIADRLPESVVKLNHPVLSVHRQEPDGRWEIKLRGGPQPEPFDAVVLAVPAFHAAQLTAETAPGLSADLAKILYTGTSVVSVGYRRDQIAHPLDGFGFVVPRVENRRILAGSFSSNKYEGRAPEGHVLLRVFVGGATQPELARLPDDDLKQLVQEEFGQLLGARGEPVECEISRWTEHMAQYHVGHVDLVAQIEEQVAALPGLELAGNAYRGVGVPLCIRSGETAAQRILGVDGEGGRSFEPM